ncbi:rhodanese-like domain-containing protein [uncultured Vibrio sp.]|uniref:rhodanese-like domain-containing protein n=1 Tax=uncultured Vibrio sp. TaxID=114054 RepID=UPI00260BB9CE|nr:rhodanese-like domain-containing protein [uncultured Vibrio sp.]
MRTLLSLSALCVALLSYGVHASERADIGWELIEKGALMVDVRTPEEFKQGHLDNAINYPLSEVATHFANIDKDQPIVLYCRSGNRSGQAYQFLQAQGFTQIHNAGGLIEMQESK